MNISNSIRLMAEKTSLSLHRMGDSSSNIADSYVPQLSALPHTVGVAATLLASAGALTSLGSHTVRSLWRSSFQAAEEWVGHLNRIKL
jgi:hypothetical protein